LAWKLVHSTLWGPINKFKILWKVKKKKTRINFVRKCPQVRLVKNFVLNLKSTILHENAKIAHSEVKQTNEKFYRKKWKKKKLASILNENAPGSDWLQILTWIKYQRFCMKTCRENTKRSKKQTQKCLERKKKNSYQICTKMPLDQIG